MRPTSSRLAAASTVVATALFLLAGCGSGQEGATDADPAERPDGWLAAEPAQPPPRDDEFPRSGFTADEPPSVIVAHVSGPSIVARSGPDEASPAVVELGNPTAAGGPLAFELVTAELDSDQRWIEVYLPIRPNGSTGWVDRAEVELSQNPFRIEIDTGDHLLEVYRENLPWIATTIAIGTGETPTPIGRFYIIELLEPPTPNGPYGSFAFGLSGYSETLTSFAGGDGVIGIHGTNEPSSLGTDVSHGCIRVANETIRSMAGVIPLGTPVIIQP